MAYASGVHPLSVVFVDRGGFLMCATTTAGAQTASVLPPYPPPGQLVDIGGWRLHLYCTGKPKLTADVILEAGLGDFSVEWSLVQPKIATFARVCSYDRAGDGWSELGPYPRTMRQIAYAAHTSGKGWRAAAIFVGGALLWPGWFASTLPHIRRKLPDVLVERHAPICRGENRTELSGAALDKPIPAISAGCVEA